jgi:hypothetical protein
MGIKQRDEFRLRAIKYSSRATAWAAGILSCQPQGDVEAGPDHDAFLHQGWSGVAEWGVHKIENIRHDPHEMNGAPVSVLHGVPLRLRCENELGFKMVKWIVAIEFVSDFADLGAGQGSYNENHESALPTTSIVSIYQYPTPAM